MPTSTGSVRSATFARAIVGMPVGSVVGAAVAGGAVVAAAVVAESAVVEPAAVEGIEMIDVVITPEPNGLEFESPRSPAHADATRSVAITRARLTERS